MAKTVYSFAWPTATYRDWELDGIHPTDHGFEVSVKLTGVSAFDGSDLWLKLGLIFTNGQFERFRVIDNNAILMQPFQTSVILGQTAVYLANQYAASNGQTSPAAGASTPPAPSASPRPTAPVPVQLEGICLVNATGRTLKYQYLEGSDWKPLTLNAGNAMTMWRARDEHPVNGVPQYYVRYLDGSTDDAPLRSYKLPTGLLRENPDCKDAPNYHFGFSADELKIFAGAAVN